MDTGTDFPTHLGRAAAERFRLPGHGSMVGRVAQATTEFGALIGHSLSVRRMLSGGVTAPVGSWRLPGVGPPPLPLLAAGWDQRRPHRSMSLAERQQLAFDQASNRLAGIRPTKTAPPPRGLPSATRRGRNSMAGANTGPAAAVSRMSSESAFVRNPNEVRAVGSMLSPREAASRARSATPRPPPGRFGMSSTAQSAPGMATRRAETAGSSGSRSGSIPSAVGARPSPAWVRPPSSRSTTLAAARPRAEAIFTRTAGPHQVSSSPPPPRSALVRTTAPNAVRPGPPAGPGLVTAAVVRRVADRRQAEHAAHTPLGTVPLVSTRRGAGLPAQAHAPLAARPLPQALRPEPLPPKRRDAGHQPVLPAAISPAVTRRPAGLRPRVHAPTARPLVSPSPLSPPLAALPRQQAAASVAKRGPFSTPPRRSPVPTVPLVSTHRRTGEQPAPAAGPLVLRSTPSPPPAGLARQQAAASIATRAAVLAPPLPPRIAGVRLASTRRGAGHQAVLPAAISPAVTRRGAVEQPAPTARPLISPSTPSPPVARSITMRGAVGATPLPPPIAGLPLALRRRGPEAQATPPPRPRVSPSQMSTPLTAVPPVSTAAGKSPESTVRWPSLVQPRRLAPVSHQRSPLDERRSTVLSRSSVEGRALSRHRGLAIGLTESRRPAPSAVPGGFHEVIRLPPPPIARTSATQRRRRPHALDSHPRGSLLSATPGQPEGAGRAALPVEVMASELVANLPAAQAVAVNGPTRQLLRSVAPPRAVKAPARRPEEGMTWGTQGLPVAAGSGFLKGSSGGAAPTPTMSERLQRRAEHAVAPAGASLVERTASLFAARRAAARPREASGDGVAIVADPDQPQPGDPPIIRRRGPTGAAASALSPPVPPAESSGALSGEQLAQLVDAIEQRIIAELERRGRRHYPGVF
jgi:hypothetical protein